MAERIVSKTVVLAGLLIAVIGLSVLPAAALASMWSKSSEGVTKGSQGLLHVARPFLIDGVRESQGLRNATTVNESPKKQVTQTPQPARTTTVAPNSQVSGGTSTGQGTQETPPVTVEPAPTLKPENDTAPPVVVEPKPAPGPENETVHQGVYSATADLRLYSDSACTQILASIDWGAISPGGTVTRKIYIKNVGTGNVTLSMLVTNWSPANANGPLRVTWNGEGLVLGADRVSDATLTLSVSPDISGISSFDVDIVISGTL